MNGFRCKNLEVDGFLHLFGTKLSARHHDGHVGVRDYLKGFGVDSYYLPRTRQVHGAGVRMLDGEENAHGLVGDAFVTNKRGIVCCVSTADCVPLILLEPSSGVVAAVHCGWRSLAKGIVGGAVDAMISLGARPSNIRAGVGPAICKECYEVGEDVRGDFLSCGTNVDEFFRAKDGGKYLLDLKGICGHLLVQRNVPQENISCVDLCTRCRPEHFVSYRRDGRTRERQTNFVLIV